MFANCGHPKCTVCALISMRVHLIHGSDGYWHAAASSKLMHGPYHQATHYPMPSAAHTLSYHPLISTESPLNGDIMNCFRLFGHCYRCSFDYFGHRHANKTWPIRFLTWQLNKYDFMLVRKTTCKSIASVTVPIQQQNCMYQYVYRYLFGKYYQPGAKSYTPIFWFAGLLTS